MSDDSNPRRHRIGTTTIDALTRDYAPIKEPAPKMARREPDVPAPTAVRHLRLVVSNVVPFMKPEVSS